MVAGDLCFDQPSHERIMAYTGGNNRHNHKRYHHVLPDVTAGGDQFYRMQSGAPYPQRYVAGLLTAYD
jgi:hypothetical protein